MSAEDDDDIAFFSNIGSSRRAQNASIGASVPASNDARVDEMDEHETPLQELIRHWMNERHSPSILPIRQILLAGLLDHVRSQANIVQALRQDPRASDEDHLRIMLVLTEVERVKFVIRSYLRTRLYKACKRLLIQRLDRFSRGHID